MMFLPTIKPFDGKSGVDDVRSIGVISKTEPTEGFEGGEFQGGGGRGYSCIFYAYIECSYHTIYMVAYGRIMRHKTPHPPGPSSEALRLFK